MEWRRKTIEIALVAYRIGYLVIVHHLDTVESILYSLVQLRNYMHKLDRSFLLAKLFKTYFSCCKVKVKFRGGALQHCSHRLIVL
jgi:hypothetical protein